MNINNSYNWNILKPLCYNVVGNDRRECFKKLEDVTMDNQQPSLSIGCKKLDGKVQRSESEDNLTNNLSTSALHLLIKDDDMIRAWMRVQEIKVKFLYDNITGIPIYFTPLLTTDELRGRKAVLSMYDTVLNMSQYYIRGKITNF